MVPIAVTSAQPPSAAAALADYLGIRVRQTERFTVTFSARDSARPFLTANEPMWEFFEPELRRRLAHLERGSTVRQRVQAALLELLPSGRGTVDGVARKLMMGTRTLQRQLKSEGTTFQTVLNDTRRAIAHRYLSEGHLSVAEIAFLLGYGEPSSFYRAFHAWTGRTHSTPEQNSGRGGTGRRAGRCPVSTWVHLGRRATVLAAAPSAGLRAIPGTTTPGPYR